MPPLLALETVIHYSNQTSSLYDYCYRDISAEHRAGGLGIYLTAAETCILYDSDWLPQSETCSMLYFLDSPSTSALLHLGKKSHDIALDPQLNHSQGQDEGHLRKVSKRFSGDGFFRNFAGFDRACFLLRCSFFDVFELPFINCSAFGFYHPTLDQNSYRYLLSKRKRIS